MRLRFGSRLSYSFFFVLHAFLCLVLFFFPHAIFCLALFFASLTYLHPAVATWELYWSRPVRSGVPGAKLEYGTDGSGQKDKPNRAEGRRNLTVDEGGRPRQESFAPKHCQV